VNFARFAITGVTLLIDRSPTFRKQQTIIQMRRALNLIGGTMFILWIIEYFGYNAGEGTHIFLVLAIMVFFVKMFVYLPSKQKA
jgi:hypothetical protein